MNDEKAFEREIRLYQDFQHEEQNKNNDVIISLNVTKGRMVIWTHFGKTWDADRGIKILNELVIRRKFNQVSYQILWTVVEYSAADWDVRKKTCEYSCNCLNYDFETFFNNVEYRTYDDTHVHY